MSNLPLCPFCPLLLVQEFLFAEIVDAQRPVDTNEHAPLKSKTQTKTQNQTHSPIHAITIIRSSNKNKHK
jgi:hypothetical protein